MLFYAHALYNNLARIEGVRRGAGRSGIKLYLASLLIIDIHSLTVGSRELWETVNL